MFRVVLIDNDADTAVVVATPTMEEAEQVGSAAIYSRGGVSAYLLPGEALSLARPNDLRRVIAALRDDESAHDLRDLDIPVVAL